MKRKILIIALSVLLIALSLGGSLAYFTQEEIVHNIITTGAVEIELIEKAITDSGETDFEDVDGVMPGAEVSKIVKVENTGASEAFVRVSAELSVTLAAGTAGQPDLSLVKLDYNTTNWTDGGDGYWYYKTPLVPGKTTEPLFTTVTFDPSMGNMYQNSTFEIDVTVQAVQSANNGTDPLAAEGWPA